MNTGDNTTAYQVVDELYVWYLADPAQPQLVGQINTTRVTRGVSLRYAPAWLAQGIALRGCCKTFLKLRIRLRYAREAGMGLRKRPEGSVARGWADGA
jgi:hypothetical protein